MERRFAVRELAMIALAIFGGTAQISTAAETSGLQVQSAIALGATADGSAFEVKTFYKNEDVNFYAKVTSDPAREAGKTHRILYKWYSDGAAPLTFDGEKRFDVSPTAWWAFVHVSHLPVGHHRAELYIDDRLAASGEFDVKARDRPNEPVEETSIKDASLALLLAGDTQHFDELAARYRTAEERTASGIWKLSMLYNAVDSDSLTPQDPSWRALDDLSGAWLSREPDSPTAVILRARFLYQRAWSLQRGSATYRQLIEEARSVLDQHSQVAQQDPEWDTLRISIAREQGANSKEILAMAERALERWPYFYGIHNAAINALLPRWGGSRQDIQAYVKLALEHSRAREGTQAYARIYYYIARTAASDPLDDLNLMAGDWPRLQQSIAEILQKYPTNFNRDIARYMAFLAGDAAVYRTYGRAESGVVIPIAWWDSRKWREQGNAWAFEGKQDTASITYRIHVYWNFLLAKGPEFWNPVRLVVFLAILLIESGFSLLNWLARRSSPQWPLSQARVSAFNPFDYPRKYFLLPVPGRFAIRLSVWVAVFAAASAYLLTTVPWGRPEETILVIAGLIVLSVASALTALNLIASWVILRADGLELRRAIGGKMIRRDDILYIRDHTPKTGLRVFELVPRAAGVTPLRITPVLSADDAFRLWFESLPSPAKDE